MQSMRHAVGQSLAAGRMTKEGSIVPPVRGTRQPARVGCEDVEGEPSVGADQPSYRAEQGDQLAVVDQMLNGVKGSDHQGKMPAQGQCPQVASDHQDAARATAAASDAPQPSEPGPACAPTGRPPRPDDRRAAGRMVRRPVPQPRSSTGPPRSVRQHPVEGDIVPPAAVLPVVKHGVAIRLDRPCVFVVGASENPGGLRTAPRVRYASGACGNVIDAIVLAVRRPRFGHRTRR